MSDFLPAPSADLAIALACVAGLAVLLAFIGLHQLAHREVDLSERLGRWGGLAQLRHVEAEKERGTLRDRLDQAVAKQSFAASIQRDLARANLKLTVGEYLLINGAAVLLGLTLGLVAGNPLA